MADFTFLRKTRCDGFSLMAAASFQDLGNVNNGNLCLYLSQVGGAK